ncbi:MAG: ferrous iron transport protein B [Candidatus Hermodarchaeota archaeon]
MREKKKRHLMKRRHHILDFHHKKIQGFSYQGTENEKKIRVALAGNANVGKSVLFNYLTGLHQHIGNWPGKTIERAEGSVYFEGYEIEIIDLPGIYSLSTYSLEEIISREYIVVEKPDVIINVIDGSVLERNLFFTLQLMELNRPMIILVNQVDLAKNKGITIDYARLETMLGLPVIPTVATKAIGITAALEVIIEIYEGRRSALPNLINYGSEVEKQVTRLQKILKANKVAPEYPRRWFALKILEQDEEILKIVKSTHPKVLEISKRFIDTLEEFHGHSCANLITSERYNSVNCIINQVQEVQNKITPSMREKLDLALLHPLFGYLILLGTVFTILFGIFAIGDIVSVVMTDFFDSLKPAYEAFLGTGVLSELLWGAFEGFVGALTVVFPYILPFYLILGLLEDSGYLTRMAYLMDRFMHLIGLHGKAFIPAMLGIGCNVPGCLGCRIMERPRERLLAAFIVTLIPCAAQTIIILSLVGKYLGFLWVIGIYLFDVVVILVLGRIAFKALPGESMGLIMEMSPLRTPNMRVVLTQTWFRVREFIHIAMPLIIAGSIFLKALEVFGLLDPINLILSPITVFWLGLPEKGGIALIFGIFRKELAVVLLGTLFGTLDFASVMTPIQMIVFSIVTMLYIPCIASIAALKREFQWKKTAMIVGFEIVFALVVGGIVVRVLLLLSG